MFVEIGHCQHPRRRLSAVAVGEIDRVRLLQRPEPKVARPKLISPAARPPKLSCSASALTYLQRPNPQLPPSRPSRRLPPWRRAVHARKVPRGEARELRVEAGAHRPTPCKGGKFVTEPHATVGITIPVACKLVEELLSHREAPKEVRRGVVRGGLRGGGRLRGCGGLAADGTRVTPATDEAGTDRVEQCVIVRVHGGVG